MTGCSIDGCDGTAKTRGWCQAHYMRWWSTGDVGPAEVVRKPKGRECSVEGCDRKHSGKGFCEAHLRRYNVTGDPGPVNIELRTPKGSCAVDGCDRVRYAKGVCEMHYQRLRNYGSLDAPTRYREDASYNGVHLRLRYARGKPSQFTCPCGGPAAHWAYVRGDDPALKYDDQGRPYSTDLTRYRAMCITCHRRMDAEATRTKGCSVPGCERKHQGRGLCSKHYQAARKAGTLPPS